MSTFKSTLNIEINNVIAHVSNVSSLDVKYDIYRLSVRITHLAHIIFSGLYNLRNGKKRGFKGGNGTFKIYVVDNYAGNISRWKIIFQNIVLYKFSELLSLGHIYINIGKYKTKVIFKKKSN